jgi:F-type H+-transporting ATPase subunit alpha
MATLDQVFLLFANKMGLIDSVPLERMRDYEKSLLMEMDDEHEELVNQLQDKKALDDELNGQLTKIIKEFTDNFLKTNR